MKNKTIILIASMGIMIGLVICFFGSYIVGRETLFLEVAKVIEEKDSKTTYPDLNKNTSFEIDQPKSSQVVNENLVCVRKGWHWTVQEGTVRYQTFQCDTGYQAMGGGIYHAYSSPLFIGTRCWPHADEDKWYCMVDNRSLSSRTFSVWIRCCKIE